MSYVQSVLMGLVQGLGEFLPISSSAHLVILPWFVNFEDPGLGYDVALHLGTVIAVIAFFWKDWLEIFTKTTRFVLKKPALTPTQAAEDKAHAHLLMVLVLATIPAAVVGYLLNDYAETVLRHPLIVAFNMILLGSLLLLVDRKSNGEKELTSISLRTALIVGFAQCLALVPGVSRSGVTITTALAMGLNRSQATRFSFLMATPITVGACLLKYKYFLEALTDPQALLGIVVSGVFGFLSIKYLLKLVRSYTFAIFSYYRFAFGAVVALTYFMRN